MFSHSCIADLEHDFFKTGRGHYKLKDKFNTWNKVFTTKTTVIRHKDMYRTFSPLAHNRKHLGDLEHKHLHSEHSFPLAYSPKT